MDYSGKDDDRSLKLMRRNDRVDFDMFASSPPSDGFFYQSHSQAGCSEQRAAADKNKVFEKVETSGDQQECINSEHGGFLKSFAPGNYSSINEMQSGTGKVLNMDSKELEKWAKTNIRGQRELAMHSTDDTAPTPIDHLPQFQRGVQRGVVPVITQTEDNSTKGGTVRLIDKLSQTPDSTPGCSPLVPRKPVNHSFFTGDHQSKKTEDGSWLFRSGPINQNNMMYEAKVEIQQGTQQQANSKNVRYVPKPSQLRELNFFSPTSM